MSGGMEILLCAVPFGCDNIGDEAILGCAAEIFRRLFPGALLTVSTADGAGTERLLGVRTIPLYNFNGLTASPSLDAVLAPFDLVVWCGATGLSDYPENALSYVDAARRAGVPCVIWNTGMNSELNPALFTAGGRRAALSRLLKTATLGMVDFAGCWARKRSAAVRRHIAESLAGCALVAVRDPQSRDELEKCGYHDAVVGADSALLLKSLPLPAGCRDWLERRDGRRRIGVCISAQRGLAGGDRFVKLLDRLAAAGDQLLFIPMNPETDSAVMRNMRDGMADASNTLLLEDCSAPGEVQAAAATCDAVLSSRLHLLIFCANVNVFPVGLERGSKVSNFLSNFGLSASGSVDDWDADVLFDALQTPHPDFAAECAAKHAGLVARLELAGDLLVRRVNAIAGKGCL